MCSTDLCNSGDFTSIRGMLNKRKVFCIISNFCLKLGYDDCSNDPCPSSTICLDTKDGFSCICPPWYDECTYCKRLF